MADQQIPFEYQTEFGDAREQERIAQLLLEMQKQQRPALAGQMVSNHFVQPSWTQRLADLYMSYQGGQARRKAEDARQGVLGRMTADERNDISQVMKQVMGSPGAADVGPPDEQGNYGFGGQVLPNVGRAAEIAAASKFDRVRKLADDLRARATSLDTIGSQGATAQSRVDRANSGGQAPFVPEASDEWGPVSNVAPPGAPEVLGQINKKNGQIRFAPKEMSVNVGGQRVDQALVKDMWNRLDEPKGERDVAMKAGEGFTKSMTLLNMLAENPMNTGTASDIITGAQKLAKFVGRDVDPRSINSETYQALVVEAVGQIITAFGSGTGVSNIDLAFSKQAAAMLQRNPGSAQAILAEAVRRYGARVNNYNRRVESGRSLASDAGLNPKIFDNLIVDIGKVKISPKLDVKGPPEEWPDTWEILQQGGLGGVNNPPGTPQVNPPPRPWGRP